MTRNRENSASQSSIDKIERFPGLQTYSEREDLLLARFAMHSKDSRGRVHTEPAHPYRSPFQRDRDRIVHCAAFRRLSGKTQVFTGDRGDYPRTRLTHTHEVASIARTLARALRLNEDLVEALALFHDIGHPPFGHAGEDALDECLADAGGFSHNAYALTIATELESRYHQFPGLNLTFEVLEGQQSRIQKDTPPKDARSVGADCPLLEAQVVEAADSMTYDAHDTDDAVKLGLVTLQELNDIPLIKATMQEIADSVEDLSPDQVRKAVVHALIDVQVSDVLQETRAYFASADWESAEAARNSSFRVGPSPSLAAKKLELEQFLYDRVYRHPELVEVRRAAQQRLVRLFELYVKHPKALPPRFLERADRSGTERAVGDYLAGMTDRFFEHQYALQIGE